MRTNARTQKYDTGRFTQANRLPIVEVASRLGLPVDGASDRLSQAMPCPAAGCATTDGFAIFARSNRWHCRKHQGRNSGSVVDLVALVRGCTSVEAVNWLLDNSESVPEFPRPSQPAQKAPERDEGALLAFMASKADKRLGALLNGPYAQAHRDYLASRGLTVETWKRFKLGMNGEHGIAIPYVDSKGRLHGVQNRRLAAQKQEARYWFEEGILPATLFGGVALQSRGTLVIVEGEFNAMSIWQAAGELVDVLSPGSATVRLPDTTAWSRWSRILCWFDNPVVANQWAARVGGTALAFSPAFGVDANAMLVSGELRDTVALALMATPAL